MTTMTENLPNRVRKLAKPRNQSQALQPFFEAVSNGLMAIEEREKEQGEGLSGVVAVKVMNLGSDDVLITVTDNGVGLSQSRFDAFCELDTEFKKERGGKGVGRLYWLDAFKKIEVFSQFFEKNLLAKRSFAFHLAREDQIQSIDFEDGLLPSGKSGTVIRLSGVRQGSYLEHFSKQAATFKDYLAAEFIADFLGGRGSHVNLDITSKAGTNSTAYFPRDVSQLVELGPQSLSPIECAENNQLSVVGYICDKKASAGLPGKHQVHLLGDRRTIESRKVDDLIAVGGIEANDKTDLVLHLVVSGEYLNENVAESRTSFTLPEEEIKDIVKAAVARARTELIEEQLRKFDAVRRKDFDLFLHEQPIFGYANQEELFAALPANASSPEDFVSKLALPRFRAERKREDELTALVQKVVSGEEMPKDFGDIIRTAANGVHDNQKSALAHHAARRRVVLDMMDRLIRRLRELADAEDGTARKDKNHVENTLHTLLVPMQVSASDPNVEQGAAHDLWLLDERLAFASSFSSDKRLASVLSDSDSEQRPDVFLWDVLYGLSPVSQQGGLEEVDDAEPLSTVFIVELKHPGRKNYSPEERVEDQIRRYVTDIKSGTIEGFGRRKVRVSEDCQFHCLVVADFEGRLADEVSGWDYIHNRRGRERRLGGDHSKVIIQAVEWDYVLSTSRQANRSLLDAAGLNISNKTEFAKKPDQEG